MLPPGNRFSRDSHGGNRARSRRGGCHSEPQSLRDGTARPQEHAEYVGDLPQWLHQQADVMIEADRKEGALLQFRSDSQRSF